MFYDPANGPIYHNGYLDVYMSAANPASDENAGSGATWFKIYEDGLNPADQSWGVDRMIANDGKVTFQIPSCIEPGQYLLRHELIGAWEKSPRRVREI